MDANGGNNTVAELSGKGSGMTTLSGGGLNLPKSIAIDTDGSIWAANAGNSTVTQFSSTGAALSGSTGYSANSILTQPAAIEISPPR